MSPNTARRQQMTTNSEPMISTQNASYNERLASAKVDPFHLYHSPGLLTDVVAVVSRWMSQLFRVLVYRYCRTHDDGFEVGVCYNNNNNNSHHFHRFLIKH
jgi:hypothetical protein